jgi:hypothetical protein
MKNILIFILILVPLNNIATSQSTNNALDKIQRSNELLGWFAGKDEFSFKMISSSVGSVGKDKVEMYSTDYFYAKDGVEAVYSETRSLYAGNEVANTKRIFVTTEKKNFAINTEKKTFFCETPDSTNELMYSKVWNWTRNAKNSFDFVAENKIELTKSKTIDGLNCSCYTLIGLEYCFDDQNRLISYTADMSNSIVKKQFSEYKDKNIDVSVFEVLEDIRDGEYKLVSSQFEL